MFLTILYNTCETGHIKLSVLLSLSASCFKFEFAFNVALIMSDISIWLFKGIKEAMHISFVYLKIAVVVFNMDQKLNIIT